MKLFKKLKNAAYRKEFTDLVCGVTACLLAVAQMFIGGFNLVSVFFSLFYLFSFFCYLYLTRRRYFLVRYKFENGEGVTFYSCIRELNLTAARKELILQNHKNVIIISFQEVNRRQAVEHGSYDWGSFIKEMEQKTYESDIIDKKVMEEKV